MQLLLAVGKYCSGCDRTLPRGSFHNKRPRRDTDDGLQHSCKSCQAKAQKKWEKNLTPAKRERKKKKDAVSRAKSRANWSPEQREKARRASNAHYWRNREKCLRDRYLASLKMLYGLDPVEWAKLVLKQQGRCAYCKREPLLGRRLHVDHDHTTKVVRGLLCLNCNSAFGQFGDNEEGLLRALEYIRSSMKIQKAA